MKHKYEVKFVYCFIILCSICTIAEVHAQGNDDDDFEVYLSFRHRGVINAVVISYYKNDEFFLPINDLFSVFQIESNTIGLVTSGNFGVEQTPYTIDFSKQIITFNMQYIM